MMHTKQSKKKISIGLKKSYKENKRAGFLKGHTPWSKGKKLSNNHRKKLSESHIGNKSALGHKLSIESRKKISQNRKGKMIGKNHPRWMGGYERKLWHINKRRVLKNGNGGSHTIGDWENLKAQYNWTCPHCKKEEPKIKLTRDHIIPISKGGSDNIENIQPLCSSCNSKKGIKIN